MGKAWWSSAAPCRPLLAAVVLFACGGHTSETEASGASSSAGTPSGGAATGGVGGSADGSNDGRSIVTLVSPEMDVDYAASPSTVGPCFRGFGASVAGVRVGFEAFVQAPGDYEGDPIHILYMEARNAEGRVFSASTNSEPFGEIHLHVTAVSPRFVGGVRGVLSAHDDPEAATLTLSLAFDVATSGSCSP